MKKGIIVSAIISFLSAIMFLIAYFMLDHDKGSGVSALYLGSVIVMVLGVISTLTFMFLAKREYGTLDEDDYDYDEIDD